MAAIAELIRYLDISLLKRFPKKKQSGKPGVYISLTTLPDRIDKIMPALISLFDQTVPAEKIILNIPEKTKKGEDFPVPAFLKNIEGLDINFIEKDLGPGTKFLPNLKNISIPDDALIIVLDDDQVYPKNLVEEYLKASEIYPESALTLCGWRVPKSLKHEDKQILRGAGLKVLNPSANISATTSVDIIQGASSYAIKKSFFDQEIFNYENAPRGAFFADDIWISGHLAKRKVARLVIRPRMAYCRLQSMTHLQTKGLRDTANADNSNNNDLYEYFKDYWTPL